MESLVALLAALAIGVVAFWVSMDRIVAVVARDDAKGQASEVSRLVEEGRFSRDRVRDEEGSHGSVIQVVDVDGRVVGESGLPPGTTALSGLRPPVGETDDERIHRPGDRGREPWIVVARTARPPGGSARENLVVLVAEPLRAPGALVTSTAGRLALASLAVLGILGTLLYRSVGAALRPVRLITAEVDRIHTARRPGRVTVPPTDDEIAELAEVMNRMLDRIDHSDTVTREFLSHASHELRSPLTTIRAALEGEPSPPGTPAHERDRVVQGEVLRMQRLVDDLLTLAKADDARLDLAHEEVDLDDVVDLEVRRLRAATDVEVAASIEAARVLGDHGRLQQVVRNLSDNAVRHCETRVTLTLTAEAAEACLTVDNDGPPLPLESREVVFDRFVRLPGARERRREGVTPGGSGLGLAIARTIVTAHGGRLAVVDHPEGLCRFEIRLPLAELPPA